MQEQHRKVDFDMEMKKTKRSVCWNEANKINNSLATKRSEAQLRQVSEERAQDKRRI